MGAAGTIKVLAHRLPAYSDNVQTAILWLTSRALHLHASPSALLRLLMACNLYAGRGQGVKPMVAGRPVAGHLFRSPPVSCW